jgi:ABC-type thiamin/hydroxymethylpyrimidine transport system permease subunit
VFQRHRGVDLFVPVRNLFVRSAWPEDGGALTIPFLAAPIASLVNFRRFSFRAFVQGEMQGIGEDMVPIVQQFLYEVLSNLSNLEPVYSLKGLKP